MDYYRLAACLGIHGTFFDSYGILDHRLLIFLLYDNASGYERTVKRKGIDDITFCYGCGDG